jgi:hypothetical protein
MHPADKAVLRLGLGVGLSVWIAYGFGFRLAFVACLGTLLTLAKFGPPPPLAKGILTGVVIAVLLTASGLMVPLLEHHAVTGVLLTGALLYAVFYAGAGKNSPMTSVLALAIALMPVAGVLHQGAPTLFGLALGAGMMTGAIVALVAHALFPDDTQAPAAAAAAPVSADAASRCASQATLLMMPVWLLALTNPALYMAAIMKTVMLGQEAGAASARSVGRDVVGSTLMGAAMATVVWGGLSMRPNLWMLALWLTAAVIWGGRRMFGAAPSAQSFWFWRNAMITMLIVLGPAIEDSANGKDVYKASLQRVSLLLAVSVYAWAAIWVLERWRAAHPPRPAPALTSS